MSMTPTQVQQIVAQTQQASCPIGTVWDGTKCVPLPTAGGGNPDIYGPNNPNVNQSGFDQNGKPLPGYDRYGKPITSTLPPGYTVNPSTGELLLPDSRDPTGALGGKGIPMGGFFQEGSTVYRWDGRSISKATQPEARAFLAGLDPSQIGSTGGVADNTVGLGQIAENQRQFDLQFPESQRQFDEQQALSEQEAGQSYLKNRADTGGNLLESVRGLANDSYARAKDPGNFPAYLAASAGIQQGAGSPISQLLGQGATIQSPEGSNPLADPRFNSLLDELYGYAKPQSLSTVQGIAAANNGTLPQAFYDYTHTQNPNAHAEGGSEMLTGPILGIDLKTGEVRFIAGEAGNEKLTFTPQPDTPDKTADKGVQQFAEGGSTEIAPMPEGGEYTPAQGTNRSLGKAIQPLGYVQRGAMDQLAGGRAPTPGSIDEQTWQRLPPSLKLLLQSGIMAQVGSNGLMDWQAAQSEYELPGINGGYQQTVY